MKEKKKTVYYRFVEQVLKALRIAHVRRYPHKQSPKTYGVWAHACILALKELENKSYRFIVDMVAEMQNILALLEIEQAPHWTTLHKAALKTLGSFVNCCPMRCLRDTQQGKNRTHFCKHINDKTICFFFKLFERQNTRVSPHAILFWIVLVRIAPHMCYPKAVKQLLYKPIINCPLFLDHGGDSPPPP